MQRLFALLTSCSTALLTFHVITFLGVGYLYSEPKWAVSPDEYAGPAG